MGEHTVPECRAAADTIKRGEAAGGTEPHHKVRAPYSIPIIKVAPLHLIAYFHLIHISGE